uniref:Uncharacterized protein n=1 Tax=viral metagenome TaxID=1070528 RepID=A0A6M3L3W2_9ZZZZ
MAANQDLKGANVTKYDAGGSGDNYISDGYIKSVEKVWVDTYNNTVVLSSNDTIKIGVVPANAKILDVFVYMPVAGGAANSLATMCICTASTMVATAANCCLGALVVDKAAWGVTTFNIGTAQTLHLSGDKVGTVISGTDSKGIYLRIMQANLLPLVLTFGTLRSVIKYT